MPSPDVRRYIDLTLYDLTVVEILNNAKALGQIRWPDWIPEETNTEALLMECFALEAQEIVYAVNRTPGKLAEGYLRFFGIEPDIGQSSVAQITFTVATTLGHRIEPGTRVALPMSGDELPVTFITTDPLEIPAGQTTGTIGAVVQEYGVRGESAAAGARLDMLDAVFFVESAVLAASPASGRNPESSDQWLDRGMERLSTLVTTLVQPQHFSSFALAWPTITTEGRAVAIDNYDGDGASVGADPGHVTVAALGPDGLPLTAQEKADLAAAMDAAAQANLAVHVIDPTITPQAVSATIKALPGYAPADVEAAVRAALADYLSPLGWPWSAVLRRNEVIALMENVDGVDYVAADSPTAPAADVTLAGAAPLVTFDDAGSTITVT